MRATRRWIGAGVLLTAVLLWTVGCQRPRGQSPTEQAAAGHGKAAGEGHKADKHDHPEEGPHGGALGEAGDETYHAEFLVDHPKKQATVYILDGAARKTVAIEDPSLTLTLTNVEPKVTLTLKADPDKGDPEGKSSRFVGTNDQLAREMEYKGEIRGKVGGKEYTWKFEEADHHDHKHDKK